MLVGAFEMHVLRSRTVIAISRTLVGDLMVVSRKMRILKELNIAVVERTNVKNTPLIQ
jgi:hypothetical protein